LVGLESSDVLALEEDTAQAWMVESVDAIKKTRLPSAIGTDDCENFAVLNPRRNIGEHVHAPETEIESLN
jgi:hypothetical protein